MKYTPHDYQRCATEFILTHPVAAVLLQMGLGKSVITLTAIRELIARGEVQKILVIAPLRVARDAESNVFKMHEKALQKVEDILAEQERLGV